MDTPGCTAPRPLRCPFPGHLQTPPCLSPRICIFVYSMYTFIVGFNRKKLIFSLRHPTPAWPKEQPAKRLRHTPLKARAERASKIDHNTQRPDRKMFPLYRGATHGEPFCCFRGQGINSRMRARAECGIEANGKAGPAGMRKNVEKRNTPSLSRIRCRCRAGLTSMCTRKNGNGGVDDRKWNLQMDAPCPLFPQLSRTIEKDLGTLYCKRVLSASNFHPSVSSALPHFLLDYFYCYTKIARRFFHETFKPISHVTTE